MKKIKFISFTVLFLVFGATMFWACSDEQEGTMTNNSVKRELKSTEMIVEWDEAPYFENLDLEENLGISGISYDESRDVILDMENSVLKVPFLSELSLEDNYPPVALGLIIGKKNVKPGSDCIKCASCIGFRCGFKPRPAPAILTSVEEMNYSMNAKQMNPSKSTEREQDSYVVINIEEKVIEYHFKLNIEWEKM